MYVPLAFHRAGSNPRLRTQGAVEGAPAHDSSHFVCVKLRAKTGEFCFRKQEKFQIFDFLQRKADSVVIVLGRIIRQLRHQLERFCDSESFFTLQRHLATGGTEMGQISGEKK